jgi:hypothetical protein
MNMSRTRIFAVMLAVFSLTSGAPFLRAQGHWEFGVHYSRWSLNLVKSLIEDSLNDTVASDLKDKFLKDIQKDYPSKKETGYSQKIAFDSSGDNYGAEVRFYPGGRHGSFSLGFSVEKSTMKVSLPEVAASLEFEDEITHMTGTFNGNATGEFLLKPLSFHLSFRWDIFPSAGLHPYITLGVGASTAKAIDMATYSYSYTGTLNVPGNPPKEYSGSDSKTLKELKDEQEAKGEDFTVPLHFVPFVQLNLGLKGQLTDNIHLLVDAGVWDGFLLRAGVSFRF